jgi:membrane protease YdiL (CAAX protease family)
MSNDSSKDASAVAKDATAVAKDAPKRWPWHPAQAVFLTVGVFVLSQLLAGILAVGGVAMYKQLAGGPNDIVVQFATIFLAESLVVLAVRWLLRRHGIGFRQLGFERPRWADVWMALLAFVLYYTVLVIALGVLRHFIPGIDAGDQKQAIGFDQAAGFGQLALVFAALVLCAPVAEEVLFRGFLFGNLRRRASFVAAAAATSLLFGAAHLAGGDQGLAAPLWSAGLDTLLLSLVLCYLREKTGRLWASILVHVTKNGVAFVLLFIIHVSS